MDKKFTIFTSRFFLPAFTILFLILCNFNVQAQTVTYPDSWGNSGAALVSGNQNGVEVNFSITEFELNEVIIDGIPMVSIQLPGVFLP